MFTKSKTFYNYKYEYVQFIRTVQVYTIYGIRLVVSNEDRFAIYNAFCENFDSRYIQIYLKNELCGIFEIEDCCVTTMNNLLITIYTNEKINNYLKSIKDLSKTLKIEYIVEHNFGDFKLYID